MAKAHQARHDAIDMLYDELLPLAQTCGNRDKGTVAHWLRAVADFLDIERKSPDLAGTSRSRLAAMRKADQDENSEEMIDLARFVREACEVTGTGEDCTPAFDLYLAFFRHCHGRGLTAPASTVFYRRFPALTRMSWPAAAGKVGTFTRGKSNGIAVYLGIRIREGAEWPTGGPKSAN